DNSRAISLIQEALAEGTLSPADQAYAAGLITQGTDEAEPYFRRAVEIEPDHLRANQTLVMALLLLGRKAEARQRLAAARAFYPGDLYLQAVEVLVCAAEKDKAATREALERLRGRLGDPVYSLVSCLAELLQDIQGMEDWSDADLSR